MIRDRLLLQGTSSSALQLSVGTSFSLRLPQSGGFLTAASIRLPRLGPGAQPWAVQAHFSWQRASSSALLIFSSPLLIFHHRSSLGWGVSGELVVMWLPQLGPWAQPWVVRDRLQLVFSGPLPLRSRHSDFPRSCSDFFFDRVRLPEGASSRQLRSDFRGWALGRDHSSLQRASSSALLIFFLLLLVFHHRSSHEWGRLG